MTKIRAYTLIEALITMALALTVLGVAGGLMQSYSSNIRFAATKDSEFLALQTGFDRVRGELRGSLSLVAPVPGDINTTYPDLRFQELDPSYAWLPAQRPFLPPATWNPFPAANLVEIHVYADPTNQVFWREVGPPGQTPVTRFVLAQGVNAFNATITPAGPIKLQVNVVQTATSGIFTTQVLRALP